MVVVAGLLVLEGALLGWVLGRRPDLAVRMRQAAWTAWIKGGVFVILVAVSPPAGLVLWLNRTPDRSPATTRTLLVGEKRIHTYKGNSRDCRVSVPADVPRHPPIVFPWSRETEPVILPCSSYAAIVPGQSRVTLAVHPGAFGLPWCDRASLTS